MAVQAQYPSSILFLSRAGEPEMKPGDYTQAPNAGYLDPSTGLFSGGGSGSSRKRGRETTSVPQPHQQGIGVFSLQAPPMMTPPLVSTGLRLAFEDQSQSQSQSPSNPYASSSSSSLFSSLLADDLTALINQQGEEIDRLLRSQADQLRRTLAERRHRHYRSLLGAAEESASRRLREKEAELDRAARRAAELEDRVTRLRAESMAWQAKALADQATAANLHSQLHQAATAAAAAADANELPADDAESAHVDPRRVEPSKACRSCWSKPISVVVMPCRHLSLCADCDAGAMPCPLCGSARTGSVHVLLS
ncbi:putative transcription factor C2H2 family [Dioscorea sansibarensis]